jgi:hypothetical protein
MSKRKKPNSMFDELVLNGIDFARRSVRELQSSPKYSMIHFSSAVELFLKARLMREHWSLVVSRPDGASLSAFLSSQFHSVSMEDAIKRLRNVANENISENAEKAFRAVREHRNRLVHFFHPDFAKKAAGPKLDEVVADQYKAWYFLNELVSGKWQRHFRRHANRLRRLNRTMHRLSEFLKAKYEALQPEIQQEIKKGILYESCYFCHFDSAKVFDAGEPLFVGECLVCGSKRMSLHVPCPACSHTIIVEDLGEGQCENCETEIDLDYLLEQYGPDIDPKGESETAYCSYCERTDKPTVVPHGDRYLCLSCVDLHDTVGNCGYYNERIAGIESSVETYLTGCMFCDGAIRDD